MMKHESLSATAKHVSSSTSLTKRIEHQWCAYALALAVVLGLAVVATPSAQAQTFTVLHTFTGPPDGACPGATLIDVNHNLYGMTFGGGASRYYGTVFEVSNRGKEAVLHSFNKANGENPSGSLIRDSVGDLYGTTGYGGASGNGTVFKLDANGKETLLHSFTGYPTDGGYPEAGLVMDTVGNLYGTTSSGGTSNWGTVFKLDTTSSTEIVLYSFTGGADGGIPAYGTLLMDAKGNLYGTTNAGGTSSHGTVFKLDANGIETVLYSFTGAADGGYPNSGVVRDKVGNFYGTTYGGGTSRVGTVFKLDTTGTETVLYNFTGAPDGDQPIAGVVRDTKGNLYGTTIAGGVHDQGTVFKLDANGIETVLHSFNYSTDGADPFGGLVRDAEGNLYGTTGTGGTGNNGTVFQVTP